MERLQRFAKEEAGGEEEEELWNEGGNRTDSVQQNGRRMDEEEEEERDAEEDGKIPCIIGILFLRMQVMTTFSAEIREWGKERTQAVTYNMNGSGSPFEF